jgi:hypothetical protein
MWFGIGDCPADPGGRPDAAGHHKPGLNRPSQTFPCNLPSPIAGASWFFHPGFLRGFNREQRAGDETTEWASSQVCEVPSPQ